MATILREVAKNTVKYTVNKDIVELYGSGSDSYAFRDCRNDIEYVYFEEGSQLEKIDQYSFYECRFLYNVGLEKCSKLTSIGDYAFEDCLSLKDIKFPGSLQTVGCYAFESCEELVEVTFPASLVSLDKGVLSRNIKLQSVVIKGNIKTIPNYCFSGDNQLVSITMPDTIEVIGESAFDGCRKIESMVLPKRVKRISSSAFEHCDYMKTCTIHEGLEYIDYGAFYSCYNLTEIYLPSTLLNISGYAFYWCENLATITFASKMKIPSFGVRAFYKTKISEITLPASVTWISEDSIGKNYNLARYIVETGSKSFSTIDGVLFNYDKTKLIFYPNMKGKEYTIPENTVHICENAFQFSNITKIVFPLTIKSIDEEALSHLYNIEKLDFNEASSTYTIGNYACYFCDSLREVHISKSVSYINQNAFYNCKNLVTVTIDEGLEIIEKEIFKCCSSLTHIKLPDSLTSLSESLFSGCSKLNSIEYSPKIECFEKKMFAYTGFSNLVIPEGITSISDFCFMNCESLKEIVLPASCTELGASIFLDCPSDIKISFADGSNFKIILQYLIVNLDVTVAYQYLLPSLLNITFPSTIQRIKAFAFSGYTSLKSVSFTDDSPQLETVEESAFEECESLSLFQYCPKMHYIGSGAFSRTAIQTLDFCKNVVSIDMTAFASCSNLVSAPDLPNLDNVGWYSFSGCRSFKTVGKMDKLTSISENCFDFCSKLESFPICPKLKFVSSGAFAFCSSIKEFTFGGSITTISSNVFKWCSQLTKITFLAASDSVLEIGESAFQSCWSLNEVVMNPDVNLVSIGENAFRSAGVKKLYFPKSLSQIGLNAFYNCSVEIIESAKEGNLVSIGGHCFENCTFLKKATLPENVVEIGAYAFNSTSLTSFTVPKGVKTFGDRVFENCKNLETFIIPEGSQLETVGYKVFSKCSSLRTITTLSPNYIIHEDGLFNKEKTRMLVFPPASSRQHINIPAETIYICPSAFYSCINLITVRFQPNSIQQIDFNAFDSCIHLTTINIPSSLTKIGQYAFLNCPSLKCGQYIENPSKEIIDLLTKTAGMSLYAVNPCPYKPTRSNAYSKIRMLDFLIVFIAYSF